MALAAASTAESRTPEERHDKLLTLIFAHLPLRDLLNCAGVCRRWRSLVAASTSQLDLNIGCHADISVLSLTKIQAVKISATVPYAVENKKHFNRRGPAIIDGISPAPPWQLVRGVLTQCPHLRELDLSAVELELTGERSVESFEEL